MSNRFFKFIMKYKYGILLLIIFFIALLWGFLVYFSPFGDNPRLEKVIQGIGMFVALFTAVVALAVANRKKERIKASTENPYIDKPDVKISQNIIDDYKFISMSDISENKIKERYKNFKKPIKFFIVNFKIINESNFDWKNPNFTYRIPISQRYLVPVEKTKMPINQRHLLPNGKKGVCVENIPYTNYRALSPLERKYYFLSDNTDIFTLINLPYINSGESLTIWFTLFLDSNMEKFVIKMSINCENAEGITKEIEINPKELLEKFNSLPK